MTLANVYFCFSPTIGRMTAPPSAFGGGRIAIPITTSLPPEGVVASGAPAISVATSATGCLSVVFLLLLLLLALLFPNLSLFTF